VHAVLARPLDWFVIQLARRCVRLDSDTPDQPPGSGRVLTGFELSHEPAAKPLDFALSGDGRFQFASPVTTAAPQNNTVHGQLYTTGLDWASRPTVVLLHGWNAELCYHRMFPSLARRFGELRTNTATMELPYHMQRRPRSGPVTDFITGDLQVMMEATLQAIADARALCRWLEAQGSREVGVWGFSLGAWLAGLMASVEPRLACAVLTTPIASIDRAITELPFCEPVRRSLRRSTIELRRLNLWEHAPCLPIRNMLLMESRHDLFAPVESVEQLWRAWGEPEIWRLPHGHISVLFSRSIMARAVGWISGRLGAAAASV
jgi:pimeloyl-ACP methyl ester carboxylesterase